MSNIAIRAEGLGKRFSIGAMERGKKSFREVAVDAFLDPLRRMRSLVRGHAAGASDLRESIWALRDVAFEVKQGEAVGVIGRNGAGKSTLLKILSRITEPTTGFVEVHGRIGTLLEVGTGFHQELTGRENVYLNGAILGMRKTEIDRKFDEIVAFAEVEKFLDTPVKHYSTGMQTRLGFAVAAHLDPEILVVDEVLAVGDIGFQNKCLGKMEGFAKSGRTVIFVSHNMTTVTSLCSRAMLLEGGRVAYAGNTKDVAEEYARSLRAPGATELDNLTARGGNGRFRFKALRLRAGFDGSSDVAVSGQEIIFEMHYEADDPDKFRDVQLAIGVYDRLGNALFRCDSDAQGMLYAGVPRVGVIRCLVPRLPLREGEFRLNISCHVNGELADWVEDAGLLSVVEGDFFGSGRNLPRSLGGNFFVDHRWLPAFDDAAIPQAQRSEGRTR